MHKIERLSAEQAKPLLPKLAALLQNSVHSGSSVGFLPPLTFETAEDYWLETLNEVALGKRIMRRIVQKSRNCSSIQIFVIEGLRGR